MLIVKANLGTSLLSFVILNSLIFSTSFLIKPNSAEAGANGCGSGWKSRLAAKVSGFAGKFNGACNTHDLCYETIGKSKPSCDDQFYKDMKRACNSLWVKGPCLTAAYSFWRAVAIGGHDAYRESQAQARRKEILKSDTTDSAYLITNTCIFVSPTSENYLGFTHY